MISDSKNEILNTIPINTCCSYSFLNSLFSNVKYEYSPNRLTIVLPDFLIELTQKILKTLYPSISIIILNNVMQCMGDVEQILLDSSVVSNNIYDSPTQTGINENILSTDCCKKTYLKTLYLIYGNYYSNNNLTKSKGYSVEFVFKNYALADDSKALMKYFGLKIRSIKRGNNIVLYLKNSEEIYSLFVIIDAVNTAIKIQDTLLVRGIRNDVNRQGNCFDANLTKTINASSEQVKAIDYIIKNMGLEYLDESLQEIALLRLANPDITLNEMQKLYSQPITRAGLKYKLDKLIKIYKEILKNK